MKFKKSALGMLLLSGALVTGCSSDNLVNGEPEVVDKDTKFYINVEIANPAENSTRADGESTVGSNTNEDNLDYSNGTADEAKIHDILFIFYNSSFQYVGNKPMKITDDAGELKEGITSGTSNGSIETILSMTVEIDVTKGYTKPAYVMAYVNPATGHNDRMKDFSNTLALARTLEEMLPHDDKKGYTMTNSVYYEDKAPQPEIATPIGENLFTTKEAADDASDDEKIKIYVERVVAKVNLKYSETEGKLPQDDNTIEDEDETKYTLEFQPLAWGLSNLERATFLVKNFRRSTNAKCINDPHSVEDNHVLFQNLTSINNMSYSEANDLFGSLKSPSWNFPSTKKTEEGVNWSISGRRSFWAVSPSYFPDLSLYPHYAEEYNDNHALKYLSFNDIYNSGTPGTYGQAFSTTANSLYTLEHTMQQEVIANQQKRGVTSALVIGKYIIKNGENAYLENTDFFIRQGESSSILYPSVDVMKKKFLEKNITIYMDNPNYNKDEAGSAKYLPIQQVLGGETENELLKLFEIYHPTYDDIGQYIPSRYVSLKLPKLPKSAEGSTSVEKYYFQDVNGILTEITEGKEGEDGNLDMANMALYENLQNALGGVEMYRSGYAYFSVPIMHLWKRGPSDLQIGDKDFKASLGQYGIVRNHIYNINVSGISGIGTAIQNPDDPIIPNLKKEKYFVRTEMKVQRWRVVPPQNATLKP